MIALHVRVDDVNGDVLARALKCALEDEGTDRMLYFCWIFCGAKLLPGNKFENSTALSKTDRLMIHGVRGTPQLTA